MPHEWPIRALQQESSAEYWMLISRPVELHAAIIWTMLQMDATFPRSSQEKLQMWWVRTTTVNNGLPIFDLDLMIYAFKAQSFPFWLKNKKETCKWRNRRSSAGSNTGSMASSARWAKWSSNSNKSQWAMSKGTRGKTEVNNDENYMFCISQHACQNNPINWSILVVKNLIQLYRWLDC